MSIHASTLLRLYKKHSISYKKLKYSPYLTEAKQAEIELKL